MSDTGAPLTVAPVAVPVPIPELSVPHEPQREVEMVGPSGADMVPVPGELAAGKSATPTTAPDESTDSLLAKRWVLGRALLGEFLCTFLFLFIAMAVPWNMRRTEVNNPATQAIAVSFIAVAAIYSFADISGAHFNPAVTFAVIVTGKTTWRKGVCYIFAQLLGSTFAAFWFIVVFPDGTHELSLLSMVPNADTGYGYQLMMEFTLTYFLIYVIFSVAFDTVDSQNVKIAQLDQDKELGAKNVAAKHLTIYTTGGDSKSAFAPIAIGFTLGMLSMVGGSVSGGAYNPARVFGAGLCTGVWTNQWVYWIGDLLGAACAGYTQLIFQRLKKKAGTK